MFSRHCFIILSLFAAAASAAEPAAFTPDPRTVQRLGPAYRYPQAGWIVLHIEGAPYDRGVQHGRLLAPEIAAYVRCYAATQSADAPTDAWKLVRTLTRALFLPRFDRELIEEMQGIADGAAAEGATFDNRPLDLTDIAALNLWAELMCLDSAAAAVPTGLEGIAFPRPTARPIKTPDKGHCSAFAATGPATADGKIVFGHISMFDLYPSTFFNVWLDVQPDKGHRISMQTYPAGIYSGMDYYLNAAGMIVCETTITQTRLDVTGETLASRMRRAIQYGDSIDAIVKILTGPGNGLYTNEWLLADTKTNEIAMLELGTRTHKLWRSGKSEWFGGTEGFYWGCNNIKDRTVQLETFASTVDRPEQMVWSPSDRDKTWVDLYKRYKGRIDASFARTAFTTPPICGFPSLDAKFTTTDLAKNLTSWALFGPPRGNTWLPKTPELRKYPEIEPMVSNPWTLIKTAKPDPSEAVTWVDLPTSLQPAKTTAELSDEDHHAPLAVPAWHGTLFPKSDADIWLAIAFSEYEKIVARERGMIEESGKPCLCDADRHKAAASLFDARAQYTLAAALADKPISSIHPDFDSDAWRHIAGGKGILLLNELRTRLGDSQFLKMMDAFGRAHAGRDASTAEFRAHAATYASEPLDDFFKFWMDGTGLPLLKITSARVKGSSGKPREGPATSYRVEITLEAHGGPLPTAIELSVVTEDGEETALTHAEKPGVYAIETTSRPVRVIVDKYGRTAKANGARAGVCSFLDDLEHTLIVRGTVDDEAANREAAERFQRQVAEFWSNDRIEIVTDLALKPEDAASKNLILIGRPSTNSVARRFEKQFHIQFGPQSAALGGEVFANARTAICIAADHPDAPGRALTLIAGLSGASTYRACGDLLESRDRPTGQMIVMEHGKEPRPCAVPAPDLVRELPAP